MKEYNMNEEFRKYVDKYCIKHQVTPEQAVEHMVVKLVEEEYRNRRINCKR